MSAMVFDLDDTLYPERAYAFSGFADVATRFKSVLGNQVKSSALMRALFDTEHRAGVFDEVLSQKGLSGDAELLAGMIDTFRTHRPMIALHADADAALARLAPAHKLGIITDGPAAQQSAKVTALRLAPRVHEIILTDELGPGFAKPHPRSFEIIARRLAVDTAECVYVADNPTKDFVEPNALGWVTVRIVRPDGIYRDAIVADDGVPQHVISSLDELDGVLG